MVKGYDWVGNYYPKKQFEVKVNSGDDAEEMVNGLILPPMTIPQRYWFTWSAVGMQEMDPEQHTWAVISGRYFNIPMSLNTNDDTEMNGNTLMNEHGPSSIGEWGDEDPTATESEIPGHSAMDDAASKAEFLHREKFLRVGDGQSFVTNSNKSRYCWYGKTNGKVVNKNNYCDILDPKMIAIGARSDQNNDNSDWSDTWGNFTDFSAMTDAFYEILEQDNPITLGHRGTTSTLESWLTHGYSDYETSTEADLQFVSKLTVEVGVYRPKSTRYYSGG